MEGYTYPLDLDWSQAEMVAVVNMWEAVEKAYEEGIEREQLLTRYQKFKEVVKSIGEERTLGREFEEVSGYSLYRVMQEVRKTTASVIKMKGRKV